MGCQGSCVKLSEIDFYLNFRQICNNFAHPSSDQKKKSLIYAFLRKLARNLRPIRATPRLQTSPFSKLLILAGPKSYSLLPPLSPAVDLHGRGACLVVLPSKRILWYRRAPCSSIALRLHNLNLSWMALLWSLVSLSVCPLDNPWRP